MTTALTTQQPLLPTLPKESLISAYKNLGEPASILSNIRCRTFDEVIESNHPTLQEVSDRGEQWRVFTLAYISTALTSYLDFVGRRNTMNDEQVAETAMLILDEYPKLKYDDIALFFRHCKLSKYGKLYDLNGAALLDWLNEYRCERNYAHYQLDQRREQERKAAEERQRQLEWEAMTEEERQAQEQRIKEIQQRIYRKLTNKTLQP